MRIFRYLFKQMMLSFVAVSSVILLIFISTRFVRYLARAADGSMAGDILWQMLAFRLPGFVEMVLPLSLFVGIMLACGRLYIDSEMIVLQACGVSKARLLAYIQGPALLVALLVALLSLWISPLGMQKFYALWDNPDNFSGISTLVAGEFKQVGSDTVIYTAALNQDKTQLNDVFIVRRLANQQLSIIRSQQASILNYSPTQRYVELAQGVQYTGAIGQQDFAVSYFEQYGELLQLAKEGKAQADEERLEAKSSLSLWHRQDEKAQTLLQWRLSLPLLAPIVAILALALSETSHRRGRYAKLLPGIVLYMLYFGLLISVRSQMDKNHWPWFSLWFVHAAFLALSLVLMFPANLRFLKKTPHQAVAA